MTCIAIIVSSVFFITLISADTDQSSDFKHESLKLNLIENNSFVQKIKKNGFNKNIETFSDEKINEAFKKFGTELTNIDLPENEATFVDPSPIIASESNTNISTTQDEIVMDKDHNAKDNNENISQSSDDFHRKYDNLDVPEINLKTILNGQHKNIGIPEINIKTTPIEPDDNLDVPQIKMKPSASIEHENLVIPEIYIKTTPSVSHEKTAFPETTISIEQRNIRDSQSDGSHLWKEKIVTKDLMNLTDEIVNKERMIVEIGVKNTTRAKSGRNVKYGQRKNKSRRSSRKRNKNNKVSETKNENIENDSGNKNSSESSPHLKQDRRMVSDEFSEQFGLSNTPRLAVGHQCNSDSNCSQYGWAYPHAQTEKYFHVDGKALFEPNLDHIPRPFGYQLEPSQNYFGHRTNIEAPNVGQKNDFGPVKFEDVTDNAQRNLGHHVENHDGKLITVTKEVRVPYTVKIEKQVPYPVYVKVPVDKPYPVVVPKPYKIIHHIPQPYDVKVKVPQPYQVIKPVPRPIKIPVDHPYPVPRPRPYYVTVEKKVPVTVEKKVPYSVHVPVDRPYPVHVPVPKHVPYTVEKRVPVQVKVPVDKPYPVYIPKPYPVNVAKPVPHVVEKHVPYPAKVPIRYPVKVPVPYEVVKHVPVPQHHYNPHQSHHY